MAIYKVTKHEVWNQAVLVNANTAEEALKKAEAMDEVVLEDEFEYSYSLGNDEQEWQVDEAPEYDEFFVEHYAGIPKPKGTE